MPQQKLKRNLRIIGILFILVSVGLLAKHFYFLRTAVKLEAKVSTPRVSEDDESLAPLYTYEFQGKQYSARGHATPSTTTVTAYVNPDDPGDILVDTFLERWLMITLSATIGLVAWGLGNQKQPIKITDATPRED